MLAVPLLGRLGLRQIAGVLAVPLLGRLGLCQVEGVLAVPLSGCLSLCQIAGGCYLSPSAGPHLACDTAEVWLPGPECQGHGLWVPGTSSPFPRSSLTHMSDCEFPSPHPHPSTDR